jgi:hypothetical protein
LEGTLNGQSGCATSISSDPTRHSLDHLPVDGEDSNFDAHDPEVVTTQNPDYVTRMESTTGGCIKSVAAMLCGVR